MNPIRSFLHMLSGCLSRDARVHCAQLASEGSCFGKNRNLHVKFSLNIFHAISLAVMVIAAGCGGSGGGSASSGVAPTVDIDWAQRSRDFQSPSSALSATITVKAVPSSGTPATLSVNRLTPPAEYQQTYALPTQVRPGPVQVTIQFYASTGAQGALVGSATTAAILTPQGALTTSAGTALGPIETVGTVASVVVPSGQTVQFQSTAQLAFTAFDANGNILAVSPGSAYWSATTSNFTITVDGIATGGAPGTYGVSTSVDGIQSPTTQVAVVLPTSSNYFYLNQLVAAMVYNPVDGKLYASVPINAENNQNSIIVIDPTTGQISKSVFIGSNPAALALSGDGTMLYVSLSGASQICPVSLPSVTPGTAFSLGGDFFGAYRAVSMAVMPGSPNTVVASLEDSNSESAAAVEVFDSGVPRSNAVTSFPQAAQSIAFGNDAGTVYGSSLYGGFVYSINAAGIQQTSTDSVLQNAGIISNVAGDIYLTGGQVLSGQSGNPVGTLPTGATPNLFSWAATNAAGTQAYLYSGPGGSSFEYRVASPSTFTQIGTASIPFSGFDAVNAAAAFGTSGLAISVTNYQGPGAIIIIKNTLQGLSIVTP